VLVLVLHLLMMKGRRRLSKIGDKVEKHSGYKYPGEIRAIFTNRAGKVRYVVEALHEDFEGMLHIFNGDQLNIKDVDDES
jgi:hypothetical protein